MLERFSRIAVSAVIVLIASGTTMAILQMQAPEPLLTTTCGRILLLKLALVLLLLLLAAINKWRLTPAVRAGAERAARQFRQTVSLEALGAGLILAATASLSLAVPPRGLQSLTDEALDTQLKPALANVTSWSRWHRRGPARTTSG